MARGAIRDMPVTRNQAPGRQSSGHSLLATVLVARLMEQMSIKISLKDFMGTLIMRTAHHSPALPDALRRLAK